MKTISSVRFKQGETAEISAVIDDATIPWATLYFTISQNDRSITKNTRTNPDDIKVIGTRNPDGYMDATDVTIKYTQQETFFLKPGAAKVEAGWIDEDGNATKTNIARVQIDGSMIREVMKYG